MIAAHLRLVQGARGALELNTALIRRFLEMNESELVELTVFVEGRIHVAHARGADEHVRLLRDAEQIRGFNGAYQLVNGPIDDSLGARYEPARWHKAWNGRATDKDVRQLRAIFLDCDPVRPKGISSTDDQLRAACDVCLAVEAWFASVLGDPSCIGHGCSGNGYFSLIALEPTVPTAETTRRISRLLEVLQKKFGTEHVKIDRAVANAARLMPAPGTWKRKGVDSPERPHRMTSFICKPTVRRVPLEALC